MHSIGIIGISNTPPPSSLQIFGDNYLYGRVLE
jgi:hypothetical protein